jgi:hypothetical protein
MFPYDGSVRNVQKEDLRPGVVLRMVNRDGTSAPFSDCVIIRVEDDVVVHLMRPMGWANGTVDAERFPAMVESLLKGSSHNYFKTVLLSTGEPYTMG